MERKNGFKQFAMDFFIGLDEFRSRKFNFKSKSEKMSLEKFIVPIRKYRQSETIADLVACRVKPAFETNHVKSGNVFESEFYN